MAAMIRVGHTQRRSSEWSVACRREPFYSTVMEKDGREPAPGHGLRVLVIDDEKNIRTTLGLCLEQIGCTVTAVASVQAALDALARQHYELAFLDVRLNRASGLDIIPRLLAETPDTTIVVMTAYATIDSAVEAMKRGAADYLAKPFSPTQIRHVVEQCIARRELSRKIHDLELRLSEAVPEIDLDSDSPKLRAVIDTASKAAASDSPVLLRGESGTGKTVLARMIHNLSPRARGPFVVVNCPTLSEELLASELFGHAKGAFTGAVRDQFGRVEAAEGGTLFLDEIGEISPSLQAKLLRFLEDKEFERVGESHTRRANVRIIAATNRKLEDQVANGLFREDLLYRLNVIDLQLPPLRERPEDILRLTRKFLAFFAKLQRRRTPELSAAAEAKLLAYNWPGNIRELRNALERAVILWPAEILEAEAFPAQTPGHPTVDTPEIGGNFTLEALEREHITRVLGRSATLDEAAEILGIDASTLWRKRKKYEV
jgi:two-component system, NtrC family, response regulator AlgB